MTPLEVSNREVFGYLGCGSAVLLICAYTLFRLDRMIRAKGYQSPLRSLALTLAFLVSFGTGGFFSVLAPGICWQCTPADNPSTFQPALIGTHIWQFVRYFSAGSVIPILIVAAIAFALPRHARRFGERRVRMPWKAVSRFFLILIVLLALAAWPAHLGFENWFKLTSILYIAYSGSAYLAKRVAAHGMHQVLESDPRPPVFYLREFLTEDERFTTLSYEQCAQLEVPVISMQAWRHPATLEQYFAVEMRQRVGPLVALGDPNDYAPPGGAAREYFADDQWIAEFRELAGRCRFLIMRAGKSENLRRELGMLREMGSLLKLFIVTPPDRKWRILPRSWVAYSDRRTWRQFLQLITAAGLTGCEYPGFGAIIGFDSDRTIVVAKGAVSPRDYVDAILARIGDSESASAGL